MTIIKRVNVKYGAVITIAAAAFIGQTAVGAQETRERPVAVSDLVACRTIADNDARLACYDTKITAFDAAESSGELLVAEKKVVDKARKDVFGLKAADNPLFTGANGAQLGEISSTIKAVQSNRSGKWIFELEDGSVWRQTGGRTGGRSPKPGQNITISRAAFGSFNAVVENKPFIKVIRVR